MREEITSMIVNFIISLLGLVGSYVLAKSAQFITAKKAQIAISGKAAQYNYALTVAQGIYLLLQDEFSKIEEAGERKKAEMDKKLLALFPALTQIELDAINKKVCQEFKAIVNSVSTPIDTSTTETLSTDSMPIIETTSMEK